MFQATAVRLSLTAALTLSAVTLTSAPALAATTSDLEPAFKGTVVTTYASGRVAKLWLNRDGSYDGVRTNGDRTKGRWAIKGDNLCLTQQQPFYVPLSFCTPVPKGGIGTTWTAKSFKGEPVRNTLVAGR